MADIPKIKRTFTQHLVIHHIVTDHLVTDHLLAARYTPPDLFKTSYSTGLLSAWLLKASLKLFHAGSASGAGDSASIAPSFLVV
jgi:hypothetical protein